MKLNKIWFKRKTYGWGWYPSSPEGWLTMVVYFLIIWVYFWRTDMVRSTDQDIVNSFIPMITIATAILIAICYRFGEKPGWRWGGKKIKPPFSRWLR